VTAVSNGTVECHVGSKTYKGEYTIVRGRVTVSCELGTKSGELKFFRPEFIAKTLLLELAEKAKNG
jgi:hypothetical protein